MSEERQESAELRREFGIALARRMGWSESAAADVAEQVILDEAEGETYFELRWDDQGVVAGVMPGHLDVARLADEFAEAVEADLKMRIRRFGEELPWT